jgi:hypothetical protein
MMAWPRTAVYNWSDIPAQVIQFPSVNITNVIVSNTAETPVKALTSSFVCLKVPHFNRLNV